MYNPFKHIPSVDNLLVDSSTNTKKIPNTLSLSLLKKLCDPSKNYKYLENCMNSVPEVAKLKEEKFTLDHIKVDPDEEDNEAFADAEMHLSSSLIACSKLYYTECVDKIKQH